MRKEFLASIVVLLVAAGSASATVIAGNLGPGQSYNNGVGAGEPVGNGTPGTSYAVSFVSPAPFTVDSLTIPLGYMYPTLPYPVTIELVADNAGAPGAVLDSWTDTPPNAYTDPSDLRTYLANVTTTLNEGQTYWVEATEAGVSTPFDVWNFNSIGQQGWSVSSNGGASWATETGPAHPTFAYEVDGAYAPEPGCVALLCAAPLALLRRRK